MMHGVTAANDIRGIVDMNYVCAVYGVVVIIIVVDWFARGRVHYRGQVKRHEETAVLTGDQVVR